MLEPLTKLFTEVRLRAQTSLLALAVLAVLGGNAVPAQAQVQPTVGPWATLPSEVSQLVLVVSSDWKATTGTLVAFRRGSPADTWTRELGPFPVNLGRTGLAWGRSPLMSGDIPAGPKKREGDGKAPAGLFDIVSAFGHPAPPVGYSERNLPFLNITDQQCIDDSDHPFYNRILSPQDSSSPDWKSSETMAIPLYRLGLVVDHNCSDPEPGAGSCIFFHLERNPGSPTAGCTSLSASNLNALALWLERDAKPVLLQLPRSQLR